MAFSQSQRLSIRVYLGYPSTMLKNYPRLENAMDVVQSIADGGALPDNSVELAVVDYLAKLATVEQRLADLEIQAQVKEVEDVQIDAARGGFNLRTQGRKFINAISIILDVRPKRDYFSPAPLADLE